MSALGQKQTLDWRPLMIRFTPKSGHQNRPALRSAEQLRQLGDVRRDPPRFIARQQLGG
jgi:hypothetical protein